MANYNLEEFKEWMEKTQQKSMKRFSARGTSWPSIFAKIGREGWDGIESKFFSELANLITKWKVLVEQKEQHIKNIPILLTQVENHTQYLNQRKSLLTQEIQLIKEVLND